MVKGGREGGDTRDIEKSQNWDQYSSLPSAKGGIFALQSEFQSEFSRDGSRRFSAEKIGPKVRVFSTSRALKMRSERPNPR